jgi:tetratricopeptide (TPR) repeat protein
VILVEAAAKAFSAAIIDTTQVLTAYLKAEEIINDHLKITPDDTRYTEAAERIMSLFRSSGAMTCTGIETIYSARVEEDIRDTLLLNEVFSLLTEKGCYGSDFYYRMAVKFFANDRSAANAIRLAELNLARNNIDKAEGYFSQAYKIDTSRLVRSDVLTRIATMELAQGKRQQARDRGEQAYELNNNNGKAVFIIAEAYAGSNIGDDFTNHAVYWVVVDYLKTAASIDPSLKKEADEKIKAYSKLFPTREEGFYHGITDEGIVYRVGGWISEVTRVRFRKE